MIKLCSILSCLLITAAFSSCCGGPCSCSDEGDASLYFFFNKDTADPKPFSTADFKKGAFLVRVDSAIGATDTMDFFFMDSSDDTIPYNRYSQYPSFRIGNEEALDNMDYKDYRWYLIRVDSPRADYWISDIRARGRMEEMGNCGCSCYENTYLGFRLNKGTYYEHKGNFFLSKP